MGPLERPTTVAELSGGPVEYRFDRRGSDTVLIFHGGHMRASLALGEDVFEELGYSVLVPSRPGYGKTPLHAYRLAFGQPRQDDLLAYLVGQIDPDELDKLADSLRTDLRPEPDAQRTRHA